MSLKNLKGEAQGKRILLPRVDLRLVDGTSSSELKKILFQMFASAIYICTKT